MIGAIILGIVVLSGSIAAALSGRYFRGYHE